MKTHRLAAICLAIMLPIAGAMADLTGTDLYRACASANPPDQLVCAAYVAGFVQGSSIGARTYCAPMEITGEQSVLIITKYLRDHPEELHYSAAILADIALAKAYPCRSN